MDGNLNHHTMVTLVNILCFLLCTQRQKVEPFDVMNVPTPNRIATAKKGDPPVGSARYRGQFDFPVAFETPPVSNKDNCWNEHGHSLGIG